MLAFYVKWGVLALVPGVAGQVVASVSSADKYRWWLWLLTVALLAAGGIALNVLLVHVGDTVVFELPANIPGLGGKYTAESFVFGVSTAVTLAASILAVAPFSARCSFRHR